jgi:tRNA (guanine10-N2)-methyltransferase
MPPAAALATGPVVLAWFLLKPCGRLIFFLPTVIGECKEPDLHCLLCNGMQVGTNSL